MTTMEKPVRVLHIIGGMNPGGAETWLMNVLRRIDRRRCAFDFLTHTDTPCFYDTEISNLNASIIPCLHPSRPWEYAANLRRILTSGPPYDIVHSHVHHFSGFTLMLAQQAGVPGRIAHSHNDMALQDQRAGLARRCYLQTMRTLLRRSATAGLGCSSAAAAALFGSDWQRHARYRVVHCGINLERFRGPVDRQRIREELGLPRDAVVIGHVGRFDAQKNHDFLLEVFAEIRKREVNAFLLLVGDGPLRDAVLQKAMHLRLHERVLFLGKRRDIAPLMRGAMDGFVFPSHFEGLSLVLLEAQAAGLPCVMSAVLTDEAIVIPALARKVPLSDPAAWAERVLHARHRRLPQAAALAEMERSPFCITRSIDALLQCYASCRLQPYQRHQQHAAGCHLRGPHANVS